MDEKSRFVPFGGGREGGNSCDAFPSNIPLHQRKLTRPEGGMNEGYGSFMQYIGRIPPYLGDRVSELLVGLQQHGIREGAGDGGGGVHGRELRG